MAPVKALTASQPLELAPFVSPDEADRRLRYVNPHTKELTYNPKADALMAPVLGPVDPNARRTLQGEMNTLTGFVEPAAMNPVVFNEQFYQFASRKFALDPAGPAAMNGQPVYVGEIGAAAQEQGTDKERKMLMKQKRKQQGEAASLEGFYGPWAPYDIKQLPPIKYPGYQEAPEGQAVVVEPNAGAAAADIAKTAPKEGEKAAAEEEDAAGAKKAKRFEPAEERIAREKDEAKAKNRYARRSRARDCPLTRQLRPRRARAAAGHRGGRRRQDGAAHRLAGGLPGALFHRSAVRPQEPPARLLSAEARGAHVRGPHERRVGTARGPAFLASHRAVHQILSGLRASASVGQHGQPGHPLGRLQQQPRARPDVRGAHERHSVARLQL